MSSRLARRLAGCLTVVLLVLAPANPLSAQPADRPAPALSGTAAQVAARLGTEVTPETRRYFGLFPDVPGEAAIGLAPQGDSLRLVLRRAGAPDSSVVLTRALTDALGAYVDAYESLFWDQRDEGGPAWRLGPALTRLRTARLAVPSTLKREVPLVQTLRLVDRSVVRGRVLYATDAVVVLWTGDGPYRWSDLGSVATVPLDAIVQADVLGSQLLPLAVTGALHALALSAAAVPSAEGRATAGAVAGALGTGYRAYRAATHPYGADRLPAFTRVAFFRRGAPPEFLAHLGRATPEALAVTYTRARPSLVRRWLQSGPFLSATVSRIDENRPESAFTTRSTGTGNFPAPVPPVTADGAFFAERATWRTEAEVHIPLPFLPVGLIGGGTMTRFDEAPETINSLRGGRVERTSPEYEESFTDRTQSSLYGGLSIGRVGAFLGNRLLVAYGVHREEATVKGAFYSTLALQQGPPDEAEATLRYRDDIEQSRPFVRATYEFMLTRISSVYATAEWSREAVIEQPERRVTTTFPDFGYTFTSTRSAHEIRLGGRVLTGGLRLHL